MNDMTGISRAQWMRPMIFVGAPEMVAKEIKRLEDIKSVEMCFTTDPFMHGNPEMIVTSNALIDLFRNNGIGVTILTKGDLDDAVECRGVWYGITLISLSEDFRRQWEPHAAPLTNRITALERKHEHGLDTWASIEPFPPENLATDSIEEIVEELDFVNKLILGRWNYAGFNDQEYYRSIALRFMDACRSHNIECKVKAEINTKRCDHCGEFINFKLRRKVGKRD